MKTVDRTRYQEIKYDATYSHLKKWFNLARRMGWSIWQHNFNGYFYVYANNGERLGCGAEGIPKAVSEAKYGWKRIKGRRLGKLIDKRIKEIEELRFSELKILKAVVEVEIDCYKYGMTERSNRDIQASATGLCSQIERHCDIDDAPEMKYDSVCRCKFCKEALDPKTLDDPPFCCEAAQEAYEKWKKERDNLPEYRSQLVKEKVWVKED